MSDEWFAWEVAPDGVEEDGCHLDEANALKDYYHKKTTAKEAALAITRRISEDENPNFNENRLWGLLQDALIQLPEENIPSLLQLLDEIQHLPEPHARNTAAGYVFKGLGGFGHLWSDLYKSSWRDFGTVSPEERITLRKDHIRKAKIEALLTANQLGGIPLDWGYEVIADTLERKDAILDFEIPASEQWIIYTGKDLYAGAVNGKESWALKTKRDYGKESQVMSLERWSFWVERLGEIKKSGAVRDIVRVAEDLEAKMGELRNGKEA